MSKKQAKSQKKERKNKGQDKDQDSICSDQAQELFDKPVKEKTKTGEEFWSLTRNKRVSVSVFKGNPMVSIRQFFEKDGEYFPTKKGISLNKDSWNTFKKLIADIDKAIEKEQK